MPKDKKSKRPVPAEFDRENICALVHADGGMGKSWLGQTTPAPRLVLDAEGGSRSPKRMVDGKRVRQRKVRWNPHKDEPPDMKNYDVCHVTVLDWDTVDKVYEWLVSGKHQFKSVVWDSLTEIQQRCKDQINADDDEMTQRKWGTLKTRMEHSVRYYRDLVQHPRRPLDVMLFLALTKDVDQGKKRKPALEGALSVSMQGYVDLTGYLHVAVDEDDGEESRWMLICPRKVDGVAYEAKDRTDTLSQHYGAWIEEPDFEMMLAVLNEEGS
jgi:AAA domain